MKTLDEIKCRVCGKGANEHGQLKRAFCLGCYQTRSEILLDYINQLEETMETQKPNKPEALKVCGFANVCEVAARRRCPHATPHTCSQAGEKMRAYCPECRLAEEPKP